MNLTDDQLSRLRTRPHRTRLILSIFKPRTVFATQITQPGITKSTRDITITGLSGEALSTSGGMTVYIGTSQGAKDVGRIRLRSATSTVLTLAENSIDWVDGLYLTVVRYFEPWGVFPRIILDDDNNPTFFKDFDDTYGNQNEIMDPVICMGPNDGGFLNLDEIAPTGSHRVWYTSSGSFDPTPNGTLSTFGWHFEGGTPTGSTAADPGYVTYTGVGNYISSLTITTTAGKSFTGRRHIRVMARPENAGSEKSINAWGLNNLSGDRESGGYTGDIWIREPVNPEDIVDGALVVIFSEDFEGGVATKIGANAENRGYIFFVGYILDDSIKWNPETSVSSFNIGGTSARMAELSTFATALDDKKAENTDAWTDHFQLTVDRALIHFLRYHSTVMAVADFSPTLDTLPLKGADLGRGNVWEVASSFVDAALGAQLVSDRQGKLWTEVRANLRPTGTDREPHGHMQPVIEITTQDWRSEIAIARRGDSELAYLEMSGVAWSGATTGTFDAFLSGAPGRAPDYFGSASRIGNLALLGQDQLNQLTGNAWAQSSALFPTVTVPMAGEYRFLDIAPQHRVQMTLAVGDTFRQITMAQKPFIPDGISYEYRPSDQILLMDTDMIEETSGGPGETIEIPVNPPYDQTILPDWDIDFPPIVPPTPIEPPVLPPPGSGNLVYLMTSNRLTRCRDFALGRATGSTWENISPRWETSGPGGPGTIGGVTGGFQQFRLSPSDPLNTAYLLTNVAGGPGGVNGPHLYRINNLDGITGTQHYTELLNPEFIHDNIFPLVGQTTANDFGVSVNDENQIWYQGRLAAIGAKIMILRTLTGGLPGGGTWTDGTGDIPSEQQNNRGFIFPSEKSLADVYSKSNLDRSLFFSNNFGTTWTQLTSPGGSIENIHIPFNANPADLIQYMSHNSAYFITRDRWLSEDDISPFFNALNWEPPNIGGQSEPEILYVSTWYLNRLRICGIFRASNINRIFYADDGADAGVNSWKPRFEFPSAGGGNAARGFEWHKTNREIMMTAVDGNTNHLYLSTDEGFSFIDGITRWEAGEGLGTTGNPDFLGWTVIAMRFVSLV